MQDRQNLLRHQHIFHKDFEPRVHDKSLRRMNKKLYVPNQSTLPKDTGEQYVHEITKNKSLNLGSLERYSDNSGPVVKLKGMAANELGPS